MAALTRRRLAVDLDGLLWDFYRYVAAWHLGLTLEDATDVVRYAWRSPMLEVNWSWLSGEKAGDLVAEFYQQFDFSACVPIPGIVSVMVELAGEYDLYVVTANPHITDEELLAWLDHWFHGLFAKEIIRTNVFGSKADAMRENGLDLLVEDRDDYGRTVADDGLLAVVLLRYLWSAGEDTDRLRHVSDLADLPTVIRSLLGLPA